MVEIGQEEGISSHEEGLQHWLFLWHGGSGNIEIVVFDDASPSVARIMQGIRDEAGQWCLAGVSGFRAFWP
jgi:hypothetical protein